MDSPCACPVVETCGGCPLLSLEAAHERMLKLGVVAELLAKLGHDGAEPRLVASPRRIEYRNRIRLRIDEAGRIAFFNGEKSPSCAVLMPELRDYINHLRGWSAAHPRALSSCAHLEARTRDSDGQCGLFLTLRPNCGIPTEALEELASSYPHQTITTSTDEATVSQRFSINATTYQRVPLDGFLQVNFDVNQKLTEHIVYEAVNRGHRTFVDLYCGSGNFALPLARGGLSGLGVERVVSSVSCAQTSAHEQGFEVQFHHGDAIDVVMQWSKSNAKLDLAIIDPPRAGVRTGLGAIAELATRSIAYCSCNPETLARDVSSLKEMGWSVDQVTAFDMFPGTRHLEVVAWLSR